MAGQNNQPEKPDHIPEGATVVKQVQYAWIWSSLPWVLVVFVLFQLGFFPEPLMALVVVLVIMVPRFFMWKGTRYIVTRDELIYQRGGITGSKSYQIPLSKLTDAKPRYGAFGRAVGYQTVDLVFQDGGVANLKYVPIFDDLAEQLRGLIDEAVKRSNDGDGSSPSDPDTSEDDRPATE